MKAAAPYDPGNEHAIIYMWGTTGIGYNADKVKERLGADAPIDSWALVFDPKVIAKLADCGMTHARRRRRHVAERAAPTWASTRIDRAGGHGEGCGRSSRRCGRYIRYFHSSQYINDLANGEICVAVGYLGRHVHRREPRGRGGQATASRSTTPCRRRAR